ncbi:hypothetical protein EV121DRAFT_298082 [Schizophyllum commune]
MSSGTPPSRRTPTYALQSKEVHREDVPFELERGLAWVPGQMEWTGHPHWVGEHRARDAAVARLYSGKRRISKGKKHERIAHIVRRKRAVRMRDMAKRVREYKELYRRRRLDPLALVVMYNRMGPQVLICSTSVCALGHLGTTSFAVFLHPVLLYHVDRLPLLAKGLA